MTQECSENISETRKRRLTYLEGIYNYFPNSKTNTRRNYKKKKREAGTEHINLIHKNIQNNKEKRLIINNLSRQ